ncbi:Stk1 family PASTA domain-containing Ser/Thr kinase [Devriesea agamarum]|uniref:Stk1 family PASTA domain-containing Ser/Thr kinase n=1 Tax=Devriesea agamarum TaxID=472569 RepID=UPI00071D5CBD|nr:Stk1 family PASTA domain-containing Ser/Thr kinase [Devriesea agamarum]
MSDTPIVLGGRYELGKMLGTGGMADVFLGKDTRLHRTVAIKILRSDLARDENFQERFRREAQSAAGLNHPTIVGVYDTGEDHRTDHTGRDVSIPYIVMEYVQGHTLRELVNPDDPLSVDKAAEVMGGVLSALEYSHRSGIVHRDIKPGNVMMTPAGEVKVMDFGIARAADATSGMTATQTVMGTAQYLSPEQALGETVDSRSDIYSAACVLYELLTGRPPFTGDSPVSIAYQHVREPVLPPSHFNPKVPPAMDQVVLKGLAKSRDDRYQSAAEFARDIANVIAGRPTAAALGAAEAAGAGPDDATQVLGRVAGATAATTVLPNGSAPTQALSSPHKPQPATRPAAAPSPSGHRADADRKKRKAWPWILLAVVIVAILALVGFLFIGGGSQSVAVPNVVGMTQADARTALNKADLKAQFQEIPSTDVEQGKVISTDPPAGQKADAGSTVKVSISSGPDAVKVPDLSGKTSDQAQQMLAQAGLKIGTVKEEDSPGTKAGEVIRSEPAAGTQVQQGSQVNILIASGRIPVPNVVGQTQASAEATLKNAGLKVQVVQSQSSDETPGQVVAQNPDASNGTTVKIGSTVQITVVVEPSEVTMLNYVGKNADDAILSLQQLGFGIQRQEQYSASVPSGQVISTNPAGGTKVKPNSTVTVVISKGAWGSPSATPTATPSSPSAGRRNGQD